MSTGECLVRPVILFCRLSRNYGQLAQPQTESEASSVETDWLLMICRIKMGFSVCPIVTRLPDWRVDYYQSESRIWLLSIEGILHANVCFQNIDVLYSAILIKRIANKFSFE